MPLVIDSLPSGNILRHFCQYIDSTFTQYLTNLWPDGEKCSSFSYCLRSSGFITVEYFEQKVIWYTYRDLGRNPTILAVENGVARICRGNGSILHLSIASFPEKLLKHVSANLWQAALQVFAYVVHKTSI